MNGKMDTMNSEQNFIDGSLFREMMQGGASLLRSNAEEINRLNVFPVPDGDTGDNMRMTVESGLAALEELSSDDLAEVLRTISHGMLLGARGNSGVILSQFFAGIAKGLSSYTRADALAIGNALSLGVKQAYASVVTPKEGTILTVAREATDYAVARITEKTTIRELFADLVGEMHDSLSRTPEMLSVLKEAGVIDSGGAGLFYIMDGFNRVLNGEKMDVPAETLPKEKTAAKIDLDAFDADSELTYGYCTEFLLRLQNRKVDLTSFDHQTIVDYLQTIGDSVVAVRTDSIVKIHVHTKTPEKVLAFCHDFGEFLTLKIENMSLQHHSGEEPERPKPESAAERKKYGIVTVCSGEGIREVFLSLGADTVVDGGQTQNPSAGDFMEAFQTLNCEHIFVFPNNANILLSANQAAEMYSDAVVHVLESKDIGQGYAALMMFDPSLDADDLVSAFQEAMQSVTTGQLTFSVRDANIDGCEIRKDDFIGIVGKKLLVSEPEKAEAAHKLLVELLTEDRFMLTVFFGKDNTEEEKDSLRAYVHSHFPNVEAYYVDGAQEVYPYIFVAE